jgi:hypothetical protein
MASDTQIVGRHGNRWRIAGWGIAVGLLLLPFVAMQLTSEVNWTVSDFVFAAVMFGGVGLLFELTVRMSDNRYYRTGVGFALGASFLTIWTNGAVGMIGSEDNPYNLVFLGVILIGLLGSALARFRAGGMAVAMLAAAIAQFIAGTIGMFTDLLGGIYSAMFAGIWLASAAMFRRANPT